MSSNKKVIFPYQIAVSQFARFQFVPRIPISVLTKSGFKEYIFLLDTGASFTTFPKFMAEEAGYKPKIADKDRMIAASGKELTVYHSKIIVKIGPFKEKIRCVFSSSDKTPFLLGRVDILDRFDFQLLSNEKLAVISKGKK